MISILKNPILKNPILKNPINFIRLSSNKTMIDNITKNIVEKKDYSLDKCREILKDKTISVIGYGPQGRSQALNLRDNGFDVIIGSRDSGTSYQQAICDGWVENKNLFNIEEAADRGDIIKYLLSDAGQINQWANIYPYLTIDKTLYFSHGFGITYHSLTNILPPKDIDVIMVAPKGAGMTVREKFKENKGINASYAIHQDFTGNAEDTCFALAFGFGSNNIFKTTFKKEVYSDLLGERCVLMGLIQGAFSAQFKVLRERGHSPEEAYNETVEEALISLYPLINEQGMDWLYSNCSTTAQRGALDWAPKFETVLKPLIDECYTSIENGTEAKNIIEANEKIRYRENLEKELSTLRNQELWQVAIKMRELRN